MKVPANLPADRLILEYLSRVAAAGNRQLPKGRRMAFVSATRNRIWREIGPGGTADPDRVREVLARLGEPEDLVAAERARLDAETAERLERQARKKEAADGCGRGGGRGGIGHGTVAVPPAQPPAGTGQAGRPPRGGRPMAGAMPGRRRGGPAAGARRRRASPGAGWEGCWRTGRTGWEPARPSRAGRHRRRP